MIKEEPYPIFPYKPDLLCKFLSGLFPAAMDEVVEVGSFYGEWASAVLDHCDVKHLWCVDPWEQYGTVTNFQIKYAFRVWMKRMKKYKTQVTPLKLSSACAASFVPNNLDLVWIDANHEKKEAYKTLETWWRKVRTGGVIIVHDYNLRGPKEACKTFFGRSMINLTQVYIGPKDGIISAWMRKV